MAALEGFAPSLSTGDLVVSHGMHDGVHIDGATLDGAALADGLAYAVSNGTALSLIEAADLAAGQVVVASCTIATGACTAEEYTDRGKEV